MTDLEKANLKLSCLHITSNLVLNPTTEMVDLEGKSIIEIAKEFEAYLFEE